MHVNEAASSDRPSRAAPTARLAIRVVHLEPLRTPQPIMRRRFTLATAMIPISIGTAHADIVAYHLTAETSRTVESLGTKFIIGCTVLAVGIMAAAFIARPR